MLRSLDRSDILIYRLAFIRLFIIIYSLLFTRHLAFADVSRATAFWYCALRYYDADVAERRSASDEAERKHRAQTAARCNAWRERGGGH